MFARLLACSVIAVMAVPYTAGASPTFAVGAAAATQAPAAKKKDKKAKPAKEKDKAKEKPEPKEKAAKEKKPAKEKDAKAKKEAAPEKAKEAKPEVVAAPAPASAPAPSAAATPPATPAPVAAPEAAKAVEAAKPAAVKAAAALADEGRKALTVTKRGPVKLAQEKGETLKSAVFKLADLLAETFKERTGGDRFVRLAVMDFDAIGEEVEQKKLGLVTRELVASRITQRGEFIMVERSKLEQIKAEVKLNKTADIDPTTAARMGKFLGIEGMIVGSVSEAGAEFMIAARLISVETGEILVAADQTVEKEGMIALSSKAIVKKTRSDALFRSVLFPGWGQLYNDNDVKGYIFLTAGVGLISGIVTSAVLAKNATAEYQENTATTVEARITANKHRDRFNLFLLSYVGLMGVAASDAYLSGTDSTKVDVGGNAEVVPNAPAPEASLTAGPGTLALNVRF